MHIDSPFSSSSLIQKWGRSGRKNKVPKLILFCKNEVDLLFGTGAIRCSYKRAIENFIDNNPIAIGVDKMKLAKHLVEFDFAEVVEGSLVLSAQGDKMLKNLNFYTLFDASQIFKMMLGMKCIGNYPVSNLDALSNVDSFRFKGKYYRVVKVDLDSKNLYLRGANYSMNKLNTGSGAEHSELITQEGIRYFVEGNDYLNVQYSLDLDHFKNLKSTMNHKREGTELSIFSNAYNYEIFKMILQFNNYKIQDTKFNQMLIISKKVTKNQIIKYITDFKENDSAVNKWQKLLSPELIVETKTARNIDKNKLIYIINEMN